MATGIELLVAAALCLACPPLNSTMPEGLIQLSDDGAVLTDIPIDKSLAETGVDEDAPMETLEVLRNKKEKLRRMREWINGKHLIIATLEDYPLSYTQLLDNGTRIGQGVSFQIIEFLQEKFNFTYDVVVPQDNIIGSTTDFDRSLIEMVNTSVSIEFMLSLTIQYSKPKACILFLYSKWIWRQLLYPRYRSNVVLSTTRRQRWTRASGLW